MSPRDPMQALADEVRAARLRAGMKHGADLARAMGVSARIVGAVERAERGSYSDELLAKIDVALGWAPGSARRITEGGTPTPVAGAPSQAARRAADLTDEELLAEISFRLTSYARELDDLRSASAAAGSVTGSVTELPRAPVPPVGVAADDPGVPSRGQQIEDFYSGLGEESQE